MADIDVNTAGYSLDITSAQFRFDGDRLSAAVESLDHDTKTDEELVFLQGQVDASERTRGQRTHTGNITWATRQWMSFCEIQGLDDGENEVLDKEYTFICIVSPKNNDSVYQYTFEQFRMHSPSGNIDKSAGKTKIACSWLRQSKKKVDI